MNNNISGAPSSQNLQPRSSSPSSALALTSSGSSTRPQSSPSPASTSLSSAPAGYVSRRQRLLGFAKTTRDTYIPRFAGSVTQLASGVSKQAFGVSDLYDEDGNLVLPKDSTITLFPSYTRETDDKDTSYVVGVKGWLSCPGLMTRKNRLILSLAKQITKYGSNSEQAISKLESEKLKQDVVDEQNPSLSDTESTVSSSDVASVSSDITSARTDHDELIKERLRAFIARSIAGAQLTIIIGSEKRLDPEKLRRVEVVTDANGHFEVDVDVDYKPSVVQVRALNDESIFSFQDIMFMRQDGLGLISDIDDTIKLTGVVGDKRELMTRLLLHDVFSWNIPPVVKWYTSLFQDMNLSFHYVSNSPWQLFSVIDKYFKAVSLPMGSVHLKQYTGNIISSLMEPSSSRKRRVLYKILEDFPRKKFICVGDSGEQDLEAYTDLAERYPDRVTAIYIRYVTNSISDVDDERIFKETRRLIKEKSRLKALKPTIQTIAQPKKQSPPEVEDLIDLTDSPPPSIPISSDKKAKLSPMVPAKPKTFQGKKIDRKPPLPSRDDKQEHHIANLRRANTSPSPGRFAPPPPLPRKTVTNSGLNSKLSSPNDSTESVNQSGRSEKPPPPLPHRHTSSSFNPGLDTEETFDVFDNLQNVYDINNYSELEMMDSKGASWLTRISESLHRLRNTETELHLFRDDDKDFFRDALDIASKHLNQH